MFHLKTNLEKRDLSTNKSPLSTTTPRAIILSRSHHPWPAAYHPDYVQIFKFVKTVAVEYDAYFDNYDRSSIWFLEQFDSLKTLILCDKRVMII